MVPNTRMEFVTERESAGVLSSLNVTRNKVNGRRPVGVACAGGHFYEANMRNAEVKGRLDRRTSTDEFLNTAENSTNVLTCR